jgi:hypothetical protein
MTGRIKLSKNDELVQSAAHHPALPYEYDTISDFDKQCGTFGLDEFQLPHPECPERFICDVPESNEPLAQFSKCVDAMDCHMLAGMTTKSDSESAIALFIHQMVPHHQNAVNMAKALLKTGLIVCDDLTQGGDGCVIEILLREIINDQNFQNQVMFGIVEELGYPQEDDCKVLIDSDVADHNDSAEPSNNIAAPTAAANYARSMIGIIMLAMATLNLLM